MNQEMTMAQQFKRALLLGVYEKTARKPQALEHLQELRQLAKTLGVGVADEWCVPLRAHDAATYIGSGKVDELMHHVRLIDADLVIIDDEISPAQQRNLEQHFKIPVIDRTEVILEVFSDHAKTAEAKLQIELARVAYEMPRLKRLWTHLSRQRGGGVMSRGEGETQIELDKRTLKDKIKKLQDELEVVEEHRKIQRHARERHHIPLFAIVGYTNAGKSTLLNALTDAGVLVEDKLFATLDTTTRKFFLTNHQEALLTDTVGFIRKLPHGLVAAFRSTLEEALHADVLIHLIDSSHPNALEHIEATYAVLKELGAENKPMITVLNKCDEPSATRQALKEKYPDALCVSALKKEGLHELVEVLADKLSGHWPLIHVRIPQSEFRLVHEITEEGHILSTDYDGNDIVIHARVPQALKGKLEKYLTHPI